MNKLLIKQGRKIVNSHEVFLAYPEGLANAAFDCRVGFTIGLVWT
jgi:hypothetical protein